MIPLFDYNKYQLILESSFKFDGSDFLYFDEGVPYYSLFRTSRRLQSIHEVRYAGEVLYYLNPDIDHDLFEKLMMEVSDRGNGHVVRTYEAEKIESMCKEILSNNDTPPYVRRYRRLIFNPARQIPKEEKQYLVGHVIGSMKRAKRITNEKIYDVLEELMSENSRITYKKIATKLDCTRQTVSNNISEDLKDIISHHNKNFPVSL